MKIHKLELKETRVNACPPDHLFPGWRIDLLDAGKSVSRLWVIEKTMRLGKASLRIAGISTVGTDEGYRKRGLASRVMQAALALIEREGFVASILHGIPDFYHRFGYAPCLPEYELRLTVADAKKAAGVLRLRKLKAGDLPALARMYNQENASRTGTIVRAPATWKDFPRGVGFFMKPDMRVATDNRDRILGYIVVNRDKKSCAVAEAGGTDPRVSGTLLRLLARRAAVLDQDHISLALPPDHALALAARGLGCEYHARYPSDGGFMGRIFDLRGFMEKAAAGLLRRKMHRTNGLLTLKTDLGSCTLLSQRNRVALATKAMLENPKAAVRLRQDSLLQLVMGFRTAHDLSASGLLRGHANQIALLSDWFPPQNACMYWPDRF